MGWGSILTAFATLAGVWLGNYLTRSASQRDRLRDLRRESFKDLLSHIHHSIRSLASIESVATSASGDPDRRDEVERGQAETAEQLWKLVDAFGYAIIVQSDDFLRFNNDWRDKLANVSNRPLARPRKANALETPAQTQGHFCSVVRADAIERRKVLEEFSVALVKQARSELVAPT